MRDLPVTNDWISQAFGTGQSSNSRIQSGSAFAGRAIYFAPQWQIRGGTSVSTGFPLRLSGYGSCAIEFPRSPLAARDFPCLDTYPASPPKTRWYGRKLWNRGKFDLNSDECVLRTDAPLGVTSPGKVRLIKLYEVRRRRRIQRHFRKEEGSCSLSKRSSLTSERAKGNRKLWNDGKFDSKICGCRERRTSSCGVLFSWGRGSDLLIRWN